MNLKKVASMIEMELMTAVSKPSDLKVCHKCGLLNWYENEVCRNTVCTCTEFHEDQQNVNLAIQEEYNFYMVEEGMSEEEVDHIYIEV